MTIILFCVYYISHYSQVVHADVSLKPKAASYILGNYKPLNVLFSTCLIRKNKGSLSFAFQHSPSSDWIAHTGHMCTQLLVCGRIPSTF